MFQAEYDRHVHSKGLCLIGKDDKTVKDIKNLFGQLRNTRGITPEQAATEEMISMVWMTWASFFSSHSGVIGHLANGAPSFELFNQDEFSQSPDLSSYGLARRPVTVALGNRLLQLIEAINFQHWTPAAAQSYLVGIYSALETIGIAGIETQTRHRLARIVIMRASLVLDSPELTQNERDEIVSLVQNIIVRSVTLLRSFKITDVIRHAL